MNRAALDPVCSRTLFAALAAGALLAACATGGDVLTQSRQLLEQGQGEQALNLLAKAAEARPANSAYRAEYYRERDLLITQWYAEAEALRQAGQLDRAEALYRRILQYDHSNQRARAGLALVEKDRRDQPLIAKAAQLVKEHDYAQAKQVLAPVLKDNPAQRDARRLGRAIEAALAPPVPAAPILQSSVTKPISLELHDVSLRTAFDVLSRAAGLNFLFDKDVNAEQQTTIVVRDQKVEDVIHQILISNQLADKVLNKTTALIYPNTAQKQREYQELMVKAFYISNADVRKTADMLRTILDARHIFVDDKLNLLVIKDTPKNVGLAQRLIAVQDVAQPEVVLDVEVLEVSFERLLNLGLRYPSTLAWSLVGGNSSSAPTPGVLTLPQWLSRNAGLVQLTFSDPLFLLSLQQHDTGTNLLANPEIRVKSGAKATIHIGDRVPVVTTTAAATGSFISQSVSYLDVGLKLVVEPIVHLDDDVGIKVGLEVSNITNTIQSPNGDTLTYQIGTRTADTVLRAHDGDTQVLAGLINNQEQRSADRVPGLGELPIVGRLFSSNSTDRSKTEIVLLITPHIVRNLTPPAPADQEFFAGTEPPAAGPLFGMGAPSAPFVTVPRPAAPPAPQKKSAEPSGNTMAPFGGVQQPGQ
ncbi:MAG: general secretion pathway protein GspD [Betaproteobacteria bacterium]|nr:general secretion pathway protein GspD [Betaproteobacteria bacterium]